MKSDYIPDSFEKRYDWLLNFKVQVAEYAATLKLDTERLAAFNTRIDAFIAAYRLVIEAQQKYETASGDARDLFAGSSHDLRGFVNEIKNNPAFTEGMGDAMKIFTHGHTPAPADIKPIIHASADQGFIRIDGTKNYARSLNIYMRREAGAWTLIAGKREHLPYDDTTALRTPGVPEEREYMARGVIGDEQVGHPSDIITVTYAG